MDPATSYFTLNSHSVSRSQPLPLALLLSENGMGALSEKFSMTARQFGENLKVMRGKRVYGRVYLASRCCASKVYRIVILVFRRWVFFSFFGFRIGGMGVRTVFKVFLTARGGK